MKKLYRTLLLGALLSALLCVGAFAREDSVVGHGFYGIDTADDITVTPTTGSGESVSSCKAKIKSTGDFETFYAGSDKLTVEVTGLTAGEQYLVLLVDGDGTAITESGIRYIDQKSPATGETGVTFTVYPMLPEDGATAAQKAMTLIITGSGGYTRKNIPLSYTTSGEFERQQYVLGDANGDEKVTAADASAVLQHVAQLSRLEGVCYEAAKVSMNAKTSGTISAADASLILQKVAQMITAFPAAN